MTILDKITEIRNTFNNDGVFSRMDKVLRLAKEKFTTDDKEYALRVFARDISNRQTRQDVLKVYLSRIR